MQGDEILVELSVGKRFLGTVKEAQIDSMLLLNLREVANGEEKEMSPPETVIKFPRNMIKSVVKIARQGGAGEDVQVEQAENDLTAEFNFEAEARQFAEQKRQNIIAKCEKEGEDPARELAEYDRAHTQYDGSAGFFDNVKPSVYRNSGQKKKVW